MNSANGQRRRWHPAADIKTLQQAALDRTLGAAVEAINERGQFHLVLAGGDTPRAVYQRLRAAETNWAAWHIYFSDERCLPPDDAARNSRMAGGAWLDHVPIPSRQLHVIPAELGPRRAADAYAQILKTVGYFDLVLLGLGEDGHTASLFPGNEWGTAPKSPDTLAIFAAPKPPPQRVSLSAARLSRSRHVLFLVSGESKRRAVADWLAAKPIAALAIVPKADVDVLVEAALLSNTYPS